MLVSCNLTTLLPTSKNKLESKMYPDSIEFLSTHFSRDSNYVSNCPKKPAGLSGSLNSLHTLEVIEYYIFLHQVNMSFQVDYS